MVFLLRSLGLLIRVFEPYAHVGLNIIWRIIGIASFIIYVFGFWCSILLLGYAEKGRKGIVICSFSLLFFWLLVIVSLFLKLYTNEIWLSPLDIVVPSFFLLIIFYYTRGSVKILFSKKSFAHKNLKTVSK